ncbi:SGNH/GDSL hydrolase family protein [Amycolatopsis japonica]|uniref:SGNH/GDSL hydrolase family protein n=1 Tax=Amycolatopsis japonica TaxID=208439 RepID=UPI0034044D31
METKGLSLVLAAAGVAGALIAPSAAAAPADRWTGTWTTSMQRPMGATWQGANWSLDGFAGESVRQVVRISRGGTQLRIRLSNRYGTSPLRLAGATVAKAGDGASIQPSTVRPLRFDRSQSTVVPVGSEAVSDATLLPTSALDRLAVTLYFAAPTGPATFHEAATATTYRAKGDHRFDATDRAYTAESHSWYYLSGVDIAGGPVRSAVVTFGDSITDGVSATKNADNRYPDQLAERLVASRKPLAVLNAGIAGNRVLDDSDCCGDSALSRFRRDALDQPGVRSVVVTQALNDVGFDPEVTSAELIQAHRKLIRAARDRGVRIIGGTVTPMKGSMLDSPRGEQIRGEVNRWIRTGGEYDAVVDFAAVLADPADPAALRAEFDAGDRLHPNDAGLQAMADAIDLSSL